MANWQRLMQYLSRIDEQITFTWPELDSLVGGLPPSATKHRAWWSGERTQVRAWRSAGFRMTNLQLGERVTFTRTDQTVSESPAQTQEMTELVTRSELILVSCVKSKLSRPAAAKDLYTSPLFKKERAYAEEAGVPWFILSAEHGLVAPEEWLAPYERYLPDTPATYRAAWGAWVIARLELIVGSLKGKTIEVHAGSAYLDTIRPGLIAGGATVTDPLHGLTMGQRQAWYNSEGSPQPSEADGLDPGPFIAVLLDEASAVTPAAFLSAGGADFKHPGLYSWWVDRSGAQFLARGLGLPLQDGLLYAGLAGATRWPSGKRSGNTLWLRIAGMHLGGNHEFSTFRRSLGAVHAQATGSESVDEAALTTWMHEHLRLIATAYDDADTLGKLERAVLAQLDPPFNLGGMSPTPIRRRLTDLRRAIS